MEYAWAALELFLLVFGCWGFGLIWCMLYDVAFPGEDVTREYLGFKEPTI